MTWKRLHHTPRRAMRGSTLASLTPQGKWLYERSLERFKRRDDAFTTAEPLRGEIGFISSVRIFTGKPTDGR